MTTPVEAEPTEQVRRRTDADAMDAICAVLNSTDSGPDAFRAIAVIVQDTTRPYVHDLPVVDPLDATTPCGLPGARVEVDGEDTVVVCVDRYGAIHIEVTTDNARPMVVTVNGLTVPPRSEPATAVPRFPEPGR
ncbi:MAG: hypothetical protein QOH97_3540 [Actinoplanes sp.]|nr:hypothetical protein [Actinoplanes sp.]